MNMRNKKWLYDGLVLWGVAIIMIAVVLVRSYRSQLEIMTAQRDSLVAALHKANQTGQPLTAEAFNLVCYIREEK